MVWMFISDIIFASLSWKNAVHFKDIFKYLMNKNTKKEEKCVVIFHTFKLPIIYNTCWKEVHEKGGTF